MVRVMISFNLNHNVFVKLTDIGHMELKRQHDELFREGRFPPRVYTPPIEDEDGWSKWQLWDLMAQLGRKCYNGCCVPFETEIRLDVAPKESDDD